MPTLNSDFNLKPYNTLALDASCACFCRLDNSNEIGAVLNQARALDLPLIALGSGSNVRLGQNIQALLLQLCNQGKNLYLENEEQVLLDVAAGENWHEFVGWSLQQGYYGLENLALIPGTVGAAPIQNIGAYGVELAEFIDSIEVFDCQQGSFKRLSREACQFAYRDSLFKQLFQQSAYSQYIISSVRFALLKQPKPCLTYPALRQYLGLEANCSEADISAAQLYAAVVAIRQSKLPNPADLPNAGSFFKNPLVSHDKYQALRANYPQMPAYPQNNGQVKLAAGWLIEQAGGKNLSYKNFSVYAKQALVLINQGGQQQSSNLDDLQVFSEQIITAVNSRFGLELEPEPVLIS